MPILSLLEAFIQSMGEMKENIPKETIGIQR